MNRKKKKKNKTERYYIAVIVIAVVSVEFGSSSKAPLRVPGNTDQFSLNVFQIKRLRNY